MKYLATYLLAILGGVAAPGADDLKKLLGAVNIEANDEEIAAVLAAVEGKDIAALIEEGKEKLVSVGGAGAAVAAAAGGAAAAEGGAAEEKKEESESEEEEFGGAGGLFGGDDDDW